MGRRARRQQFLLSTATLVGALSGYAGRAYATCTFQGNVGGRNQYQCSGYNNTTQLITGANSDNAEVFRFRGSRSTPRPAMASPSRAMALFRTPIKISRPSPPRIPRFSSVPPAMSPGQGVSPGTSMALWTAAFSGSMPATKAQATLRLPPMAMSAAAFTAFAP